MNRSHTAVLASLFWEQFFILPSRSPSCCDDSCFENRGRWNHFFFKVWSFDAMFCLSPANSASPTTLTAWRTLKACWARPSAAKWRTASTEISRPSSRARPRRRATSSTSARRTHNGLRRPAHTHTHTATLGVSLHAPTCSLQSSRF